MLRKPAVGAARGERYRGALMNVTLEGGVLVIRIPIAVVAKEVETLPREILTAQEDRVARLILEGFRDKDIACEMSISVNTAKRYVGQVFRKLNCATKDRLRAKFGFVGERGEFTAPQTKRLIHPKERRDENDGRH